MVQKQRGRVFTKRLFGRLMVVSLLLLLLPHRVTDRLGHVVSRVVGPLSLGARQMSLAVTEQLPTAGRVQVSSEQYNHIKRQFERMASELANVRAELRRQQELNVTLSGLRSEFGLARARLVVAEVTGSASSDWSQTLYLNRGSADGVREGQLALGVVCGATNGNQPAEPVYHVVGRVKTAGARTAYLQLVTDPDFSLPVFIVPGWDRNEDWRAEGQLYGREMGYTAVGFISVEHPVRAGDAVLACSDPSCLPVEMLVGWVRSCRPDDKNPVLWQINVAPAAQLHSLEQVIIVDTAGDEQSHD